MTEIPCNGAKQPRRFFALSYTLDSVLRAADGPGAACAAQERERRGAPRPRKSSTSLVVSRPQALNEDLSDRAEACPLARQPVFAVAIGRSRAPTGRGGRAKLPARTTTVGG